MAGFADILGTLIQSGMSKSGSSRAANALEGASPDALGGLMGSLGQMLGGGQSSSQGSQKGALGGMLGSVIEGVGQNLGGKKMALGGLGALAGALLGGGKSSARGAVGGGSLAMLASLAFSALKKSGQQPGQPPRALFEPENKEEEAALDHDAALIVKAMINAAKADGKIDEEEVEKILGKLKEDGLRSEEQEFFLQEARKPLNIGAVISSAGGDSAMAAQIYAASLLAIEVDTPAEKQYLQELATGLGLHPQVTSYIASTLGVQSV